MMHEIINPLGKKMRITATIQDSLIKELLLLTHTTNKTGAINAAIKDWIMYKKREKLRGLRGKLDIQDFSIEQSKLELNELHHDTRLN